MVGTSAVVAFLTPKLSRARRNAGTVRTIMGLCDIRTQSFGVKGGGFFDLAAGGAIISRPLQHRQAGVGLGHPASQPRYGAPDRPRYRRACDS